MKPSAIATSVHPAGRGTLVAMAVTYCLGVFNDNYFKQAAMLLAVAAGSSQLQGWAAVLFALPFILFAAHGGWCADRFPKKRVVVLSKGLELAAMLIGAAGLLSGNWPCILAMVFLMGLQSTIFSPALNGSIPELYPPDSVPRVNATLKLVTTLAILIGMAAAGICLDLKRPGLGNLPVGIATVATVAVLAATAGLLASFAMAGQPDTRPAATRNFPWLGPWSSLRDLLHICRDRELLLAVCADAFFYFLASATILVINGLGLRQLGLSQTMTSLLSVFLMLGVCAGSFLASRLVTMNSWSRHLVSSACGMAAALCLAGLAESLTSSWQFPWLAFCLAAAGTAGGLFLIPVTSALQTLPGDTEKGRVLAASGFSSFSAILLSGLLYNGVEPLLQPTSCLLGLGLFGFLAASSFFVLRANGSGHAPLADRLLRVLLSLRYRIEVSGLETVLARGNEGILFLPNHPALIDPAIVMSALLEKFRPRPLSDADQAGKPVVRQLMRPLRPIIIPDPAKYGHGSAAAVHAAMNEVVAGLATGDNILFYPAGHLNRSARESLAGNSGVEFIVRQLPAVRTVLVRTRGLWGSSFSWASGRAPSLPERLAAVLRTLVCNGFIFTPKRKVTLEFVEDTAISGLKDRTEINRYLEGFYNKLLPVNTHVPYFWWQGSRPIQQPEPRTKMQKTADAAIPDFVRTAVIGRLETMSGARVEPAQSLAGDLALDSLTILELSSWLESEFGADIPEVGALVTVQDCLIAAAGLRLAQDDTSLPVPDRQWFTAEKARLELPAAKSLTEAFILQASRQPNRVILADRTAGCKTYREIVAAIFALLPTLEKIPGERVGIMLPASVGAAISYLAVLFSGRIPVLFNWTAGIANMAHGIEVTGVDCIISARPLCRRIVEQQNIRLGKLPVRWLYLEELTAGLKVGDKALALAKAVVLSRRLVRRPVPDTAAILFTSGSEARPKAVPLSHANILANLQDFCRMVELRDETRLLGMLPPFHSLGLVGTIILPLCLGARTVYHPNPTEPAMLAKIIDRYQVSMLISTPTFFQAILQVGRKRLQSLRTIFTGAEKCPEQLRQLLTDINQVAELCEGYGITECSPLVAINAPGETERGTIGRVLPSIEYMVVSDDLDRRVATGEQGLLLVRGPSIFQGYLNSPSDQGFCAFEGKPWYQTGDYVREAPNRHLVFCGRKKRFVKIGGEMISLPAIETVLQTAASSSAAGPTMAVEAGAADGHPEIVLFTTEPLEREEVNLRLKNAGLSALHTIRRVIRLERIPVLGSGKTDYVGLRRMLAP